MKFFPASGVDVAADALDINCTFDSDENIRLKADVVDMVIPAGMFAEGGEVDSFGSRIPPLCIEPSDNSLQN
jgi:hypothetical protein